MSDSTPKFRFVGATGTTTRDRISWPLEVQAIVLRNKFVGKLSATAAFEAGVLEYNELVEAGEINGEPMPTELPKSYANKNAGAVLYGLKKRFENRINKGHKETIEAGVRFGAIEMTEVETITSDDVGELDVEDLDLDE